MKARNSKELKTVRVDSMTIDPKYQRYVKKWEVQRLVDLFDWDCVEFPEVNIRPSGETVVLDGQHTILAIRHMWPNSRDRKGPIALKCKVNRGLSGPSEARRCLYLNRLTRPHTRSDKFHALSAARDPQVMTVREVLAKNGITAVYAPKRAGRRETLAGYVFLDSLRRLGHTRFKFMVSLLRGDFGDDPSAMRAMFLRGLTLYLERTLTSTTKIKTRLSGASAGSIVGRASGDGTFAGWTRTGLVAKYIAKEVG